jgi:hypothetical protein
MTDELIGDQNPSYEELADHVGKLELEAAERQLTMIGIWQTMDAKEEKQAVRSYPELVKLIESFEAKRAAESKKTGRADQRQQVAQAVQTAQRRAGSALPYIEKEAKTARDELAKIVARIKIPKLELGNVAVKQKSQLVLSNLTVSDQIRELEKIIAGISGSAFDDEHIKIIKKEMKGLKAMIANEKRLSAKGKLKMSDPESALWELRNRRFAEAGSALHI